ncbi:kinase [Lysobacter sp. PAGU 2638]
MVDAAASRGVHAVTLSLDDAYLDRPQRLAFARDVHPLLATRGPPGTHDVDLITDTLDALREGRAVRLPRFDKLADRRLPESRWPRVDRCDLVIVDGWCLKVPADDASALAVPLNAIERDDDADGTWRRYCNDALGRDYPTLWSRLPRLLWLAPPGFDVVYDWRWEQECTARASRPGAGGMDRAGIDRFVQLFERTSRRAIATLPHIAGWTLRLDENRRPDAADLAGLLRPPTIDP